LPAGDRPTRRRGAGDRFVLPGLLAKALREHAGDRLEIGEYELPWPDEPFRDVAAVSEACGSEEEIIEALGDARICVTRRGAGFRHRGGAASHHGR
jgi:hypothetical protein